jgi:pheromone a factor receptor
MRAYFNLISYANGPQPFAKGPSVGGPINLATVGVVTESMVTPDMRRSMLLQWYTVVACSIVFFFCFATGKPSRTRAGAF